jgi:hypothetical protein
LAIYGNWQLGVYFAPVVEVRADGFVFKGRRYGWGEVTNIELWEGSQVPIWGEKATARVRLRNGATIAIKDVSFAKKGGPLIAGYSSAFDELIALFKGNMHREAEATRDRRDDRGSRGD